MSLILFSWLDCLTNNPFIMYPIVLLCSVASCVVVYRYTGKAISYYTRTPCTIIFSFLGYIIYLLMHIIASKEIQTVFYMPANQLPHTLIILTLLLCIPAWLCLISLWIKIVHWYFCCSKKNYDFFNYVGLGAISIILLSLSFQLVNKLGTSEELIRQIATYADYVDKRFIPSSFNHPEQFDGFLIIDEQTISLYRKTNGITQFKPVKNTLWI